MVIHRSKFPKKTSGHHARGKVTKVYEDGFVISRNIPKFNKDKGIEEKVSIDYIFKHKDYNYVQKPTRGANVLMRYRDLKSKEGKYGDPKKNMPFEVLTLRGEWVYKEDFV